MGKFRDKYRIPSTRLATWDYGSNAGYFITICTANHLHYFGVIVQGAMILNPLGQAAVACWTEIPAHFPFVVLDGFVVMPNHIHGIVIIDKPDLYLETQRIEPVETQNIASLQQHNRFGPQSQNLASIVRGYKIGVTKFARHNAIPFQWQTRYHDHIIRNGDEYERIRRYIDENPTLWEEDRYYAE